MPLVAGYICIHLASSGSITVNSLFISTQPPNTVLIFIGHLLSPSLPTQ